MGTFFANLIKGGLNDAVPTVKWRVRNRGGATAVAIGDIMAFDLTAGQSETAAGEGPGGLTGLPVDDAVWLNIIDPTVPAALLGNVYCVVTDLLDGAGADNTEVVVTVQGAVNAKCHLNATRNLALTPAGTASLRELILIQDAAGVCRPVAYARTAQDTSSTAALAPVIFFGWAGWVGGAQT
jgi:hypothetical protein